MVTVESVTFDTLGCAETSHIDNGISEFKSWGNGDLNIGEEYLQIAPDWESLDREYLRESIGSGLPEGTEVLDFEVSEISGAPAVVGLFKGHQQDTFMAFANIMILFAECMWSVQIQIMQAEEPEALERLGRLVTALIGSIRFTEDVSMLEPYSPGT